MTCPRELSAREQPHRPPRQYVITIALGYSLEVDVSEFSTGLGSETLRNQAGIADSLLAVLFLTVQTVAMQTAEWGNAKL